MPCLASYTSYSGHRAFAHSFVSHHPRDAPLPVSSSKPCDSVVKPHLTCSVTHPSEGCPGPTAPGPLIGPILPSTSQFSVTPPLAREEILRSPRYPSPAIYTTTPTPRGPPNATSPLTHSSTSESRHPSQPMQDQGQEGLVQAYPLLDTCRPPGALAALALGEGGLPSKACTRWVVDTPGGASRGSVCSSSSELSVVSQGALDPAEQPPLSLTPTCSHTSTWKRLRGKRVWSFCLSVHDRARRAYVQFSGISRAKLIVADVMRNEGGGSEKIAFAFLPFALLSLRVAGC